MDSIAMPPGAEAIVDGLQRAGYETYVVGGCVRDSLLGLKPHDWDICTAATPEEMKAYFTAHGIRTIDTGIKHGTVTADMGQDGLFEVTTFRGEDDDSELRPSDAGRFSRSITQDLSRRDLTINAMAYHHAGLIDPFHGREDLANGVIACVGNADDRLTEDALRVMRALRFASVFGFTIAEETAVAIHRRKDMLRHVAAERINAELGKLICGDHALDLLLAYRDVMAVIIPELSPCIGFEQNNRHHQYTVYDHMMHAVASSPSKDLTVRLALLLHDIGKPLCYSEDANGGHFHGHSVPSRDLARSILERLKFDNRTKNAVSELVLYHDADIEPTAKAVRRWLNRIGEERLLQLLFVKEADTLAHAPETQAARLKQCQAVRATLDEVLKEKPCFKLADLHVNGKDILALGVPAGKRVGEILQALLEKVIAGNLENTKDSLIDEARKML